MLCPTEYYETAPNTRDSSNLSSQSVVELKSDWESCKSIMSSCIVKDVWQVSGRKERKKEKLTTPRPRVARLGQRSKFG